MIYLLTQMFLALAVAALMGGALGWIVHRASHSRQLMAHKSALTRQHKQLMQAQTDIGMLTDDYDELHRNTQDQISSLQHDNRQIPSLSSNLEKSQLLVRQMMQKHEAKVHELTNKNNILQTQLKNFEEQEHDKNRLAAELDARRRQEKHAESRKSQDREAQEQSVNARFTSPNDELLLEDSLNELSEAVKENEILNDELARLDDSQIALEVERIELLNAEAQAQIPIEASLTTSVGDDTSDNDAMSVVADASSFTSNVQTPSSIEPPSESALEHEDSPVERRVVSDEEDDPFDQVIEFSEDLHTEISLDDQLLDTDQVVELDASIAEELISNEFDEPLEPQASEQNPVDTPEPHNEQLKFELSEATTAALSEHHQSAADDIQRDTALENSQESASVFESHNSKDDLKQIFGIGPLTEQALYELGITSYSQLAELKEHDIQKIADALEIVPARIERDNWVGNARRQLEEVLEQL